MPDQAYKTRSGETRYRHITSSQQRLMAKQKWEATVARHKAQPLEPAASVTPRKKKLPHLFCGANDCLWQTRLSGTPVDEKRVNCLRHQSQEPQTYGPGPADSSEPPLPARHCSNCVESMKALAKEAIAKATK